MITDVKYTSDHDRRELMPYLQQIKNNNGTIIDIGGDIKSFYSNDGFDIENLRTAIVDFDIVDNSKINFTGNISLYKIWHEILYYVNQNGLFDFCYASHILEDISNPMLVCNMLSLIAKEGFIATPSKYAESKRHGFPYRGYMHHRWIFDIKDKNFIGYPKQNFIEYVNIFDKLANQLNDENRELQIYWKNEIKLNIINNDFLGPTDKDILEYYKRLL